MPSRTITCPHCGTAADEPFFALRGVPAFCNVLWSTEDEARNAATGDIELCYCPTCGLVFNRVFDPALVNYAPGYENPLHFSERFRTFADELCARLIEQYRLRGGLAVEIGCGDADFLCRLTAAGMKRGIGFDPSLEDNHNKALAEFAVEVFAEPFGQRHLPSEPDLVLCRHVLEHISAPGEWLSAIRADIGDHETLFYCEVPNAEWLLESCSLWDVIYEHATYWMSPSISRLFQQSGFEVKSVGTGFAEQFLMLEATSARPQSPAPLDPGPGRSLCESFGRTSTTRLEELRRQVREATAAGRTAIAWGAGSKGVTFANLVTATDASLAGMVDINPGKHGKFIPGAAIPVLSPEQLPALQPALVYVMNVTYLDEIRAQLAALGLTPELVPVTDSLSS